MAHLWLSICLICVKSDLSRNCVKINYWCLYCMLNLMKLFSRASIIESFEYMPESIFKFWKWKPTVNKPLLPQLFYFPSLTCVIYNIFAWGSKIDWWCLEFSFWTTISDCLVNTKSSLAHRVLSPIQHDSFLSSSF